jgi:hypothetical protein
MLFGHTYFQLFILKVHMINEMQNSKYDGFVRVDGALYSSAEHNKRFCL